MAEVTVWREGGRLKCGGEVGWREVWREGEKAEVWRVGGKSG